MGKKNWKDFLLSSGLPLEYAVTDQLRKLNFSYPSEYKYEKRNESGQEVVFSVDVFGQRYINNDLASLEVIIECKYRFPGTQWIFLPLSFHERKGTEFKDTFVTLDCFCTDKKLNTKILNSFSNKYPLCSKGIEIYSNGSNPKTIKQAVNQLQYAVVDRVSDVLWDQWSEKVFDEFPLLVILVPIIVTTAELYRINEGMTIDNIRSSENVEDIGEKVDFLLIHEQPDNQLRKHTLNKLRGVFDKELWDGLDEDFKNTEYKSFLYYTKQFSDKYPSIFAVMSFDAMEKRLKNTVNFFDQTSIIV